MDKSLDEGEHKQCSFLVCEEAMISIVGRMEDQSNRVIFLGFILLVLQKQKSPSRMSTISSFSQVHKDKSSQ